MQLSQMNRQQLLEYIDMVSLAVLESGMFLDTHPECMEAQEYFHHYHKLRSQALEDYAERFTPLTLDTATCAKKWEWVYGKWPWEGGSC